MSVFSKYGHKFKYALQGLITAIRTEDNMKIHLLAAVLVILWGLYAQIPLWKWAVLFPTIALVIICEMINTAIETSIDLIKDSYHPLAKQAKDIAAGAVLVAAIMAVFVGVVIFFW